MKLPILYKRSVSGKINQWQIEIEGNKFRTISGYTDGLHTTSSWTECDTKNIGKKNATTAEQQALAEAQAMHRKRIELGSFEDINKIDEPVYFKPMLAKEYNKEKPKLPLYSDEKLDGVRCIIKSDGMWSRNGKQILSAPHIYNSLIHLFNEDPHLVLDGELYCDKDKADFNTIISCVRKTKPTTFDLDLSEYYIEYRIYDCPSHSGVFSERKNYLKNLNLPENCIVLQSILCSSYKEIDILYKKYLEQGYEGQMLRTDSYYENKRSKNLLKRKEFIDAEFEILGVVEGNGNLQNKVGKLLFEMPNGEQFEAAVNGDWEYIGQLWKDRKSLIGKMATVKYFELTEITERGGGVPRFPKVIGIRDFE